MKHLTFVIAVASMCVICLVTLAMGCGYLDERDAAEARLARSKRDVNKGERVRRKFPRHRTTTTTPAPQDDEDEDELTTEDPYLSENTTGIYEGENCTVCEWREERKRIRIEMIKEDILRKLRLEAPPNISVKPEEYPKIPLLNATHLSEYQYQPEPEMDEEDENKVTRVITFADSPPEDQWPCLEEVGKRPQDVIFFDFTSDMHSSRINQAVLYLYLKERHDRTPNRFRVELYRVYRDMSGKLSWADRPDIAHKVLAGDTGRWLTFHVKNIAADWIRRPMENFGFLVRTKNTNPETVTVLADQNNDDNDNLYKPFLEVHLGKVFKRKKRSAPRLYHDCEEGSKEWRCCRYPLVVDFDAFDWDWIVQPRRYLASYCSGKCSVALNTNSPHAHIVSLAKADDMAGPCCTPVKMSPISMIYFDDRGRLMYRILQDMVVDRCGCN